MLNIDMIKNMNLDNNDDIKLIESIKEKNNDFYNFLMNNFDILKIIETLKNDKKVYLKNGTTIKITGDKFEIGNIFTNEKKYTDSIFNE